MTSSINTNNVPAAFLDRVKAALTNLATNLYARIYRMIWSREEVVKACRDYNWSLIQGIEQSCDKTPIDDAFIASCEEKNLDQMNKLAPHITILALKRLDLTASATRKESDFNKILELIKPRCNEKAFPRMLAFLLGEKETSALSALWLIKWLIKHLENFKPQMLCDTIIKKVTEDTKKKELIGCLTNLTDSDNKRQLIQLLENNRFKEKEIEPLPIQNPSPVIAKAPQPVLLAMPTIALIAKQSPPTRPVTSSSQLLANALIANHQNDPTVEAIEAQKCWDYDKVKQYGNPGYVLKVVRLFEQNSARLKNQWVHVSNAISHFAQKAKEGGLAVYEELLTKAQKTIDDKMMQFIQDEIKRANKTNK